MKVNFEFRLPDDNDNYFRFIKANDYFFALSSFKDKLEDMLNEYDIEANPTAVYILNRAIKEFASCLSSNEIILE